MDHHVGICNSDSSPGKKVYHGVGALWLGQVDVCHKVIVALIGPDVLGCLINEPLGGAEHHEYGLKEYS